MSEKMHIREFKFNLSRDHSTNFRITRSISLLGDALNSCADRSTTREILAITDLILILVLIFYLWLSEVLAKGRRCYIRNATSSLVGRDLAQLCFVNGHWSCLYLAGVSLLCILLLFQKRPCVLIYLNTQLKYCFSSKSKVKRSSYTLVVTVGISKKSCVFPSVHFNKGPVRLPWIL